jgi:hypothetical protein
VIESLDTVDTTTEDEQDVVRLPWKRPVLRTILARDSLGGTNIGPDGDGGS